MSRKRLIWQLYPPFVAVTIMALAAATLYFSYAFRGFHLRQTREELRILAGVALPQVAGALDAAGAEDIDAVAKRLGRAGDNLVRFTVIAPAGRVLGDSHEDPAVMEDHSDRQEIVAALRRGFGQSVRFSPTLGRQMMYVAVPVLRDGQPVAVVRTAMAVTEIDQTLRGIYVSIAWAGLAIALCAAALSLLVSRNISRPIVRMRRTARLFAQGQLNTRVPPAGAAELDDLADALNEMAGQLHDRILTITRQRNELETILSSMAEGVFAVDATGRLVSINKAAAQLLDLDPARAQGRSVEEIVHNVGVQQFVREMLAGNQTAEGDVSFPADGERLFHVRGACLTDPRGLRAGVVIVLSDVTRIHRLENLRRDFVANVSHELKTPVTSIQGFVEALQEGGLADAEQAKRYLGIIARHAHRLNAIIDDLLTLSRLEEGSEQRALTFEVHKLRPVLEEAVDLSGVRAEEKHMRLELSCGADLEARINAPLLEQALINLIDNAVKYSDPGGVVRVHAVRQGDEVTIAVSDTGYGIAAPYLTRIFERFYVVDKSRSRKLGGTGLGLAIVKHIAQVHGGRVTVESAPGRGSTFTIHLPA